VSREAGEICTAHCV